MKLTQSCARFAAVSLFLSFLAGCKEEPLPVLPCDTTTLILSHKVIQSTPEGLRVIDAPDLRRADTLKFTGGYTLHKSGGMFGKSWVYLDVTHRGRPDSVYPIGLITSLWNVNEALPPIAVPIKNCYDTVKAHFPDAN
jgi:hypothetical protein